MLFYNNNNNNKKNSEISNKISTNSINAEIFRKQRHGWTELIRAIGEIVRSTRMVLNWIERDLFENNRNRHRVNTPVFFFFFLAIHSIINEIRKSPQTDPGKKKKAHAL